MLPIVTAPPRPMTFRDPRNAIGRNPGTIILLVVLIPATLVAVFVGFWVGALSLDCQYSCTNRARIDFGMAFGTFAPLVSSVIVLVVSSVRFALRKPTILVPIIGLALLAIEVVVAWAIGIPGV